MLVALVRGASRIQWHREASHHRQRADREDVAHRALGPIRPQVVLGEPLSKPEESLGRYPDVIEDLAKK